MKLPSPNEQILSCVFTRTLFRFVKDCSSYHHLLLGLVSGGDEQSLVLLLGNILLYLDILFTNYTHATKETYVFQLVCFEVPIGSTWLNTVTKACVSSDNFDSLCPIIHDSSCLYGLSKEHPSTRGSLVYLSLTDINCYSI